MVLFLFLFGGISAILPPSHEGRVVYVTQAGQGVMINYGSAPHISPLRSLRLTVSDYTPFIVCLQPVRGVLIDIQVGLRENSATLTSSHLESLISTVRNPYDIVGPTMDTTLMGGTRPLRNPSKPCTSQSDSGPFSVFTVLQVQ